MLMPVFRTVFMYPIHQQYITDEKGLLRKIAGGDVQAFRRLYDHYQPHLMTFIFRITRSRELTEEVVQDIFLKVWMTREALSGVECFKDYLFIISRNQALNMLDKQLRLQEKIAAYKREAAQHLLQQAADTEPDLSQHLIDTAIDSLPDQQRKAWLLSRHERYTYQQIAVEMNLSPLTVKRYIRLANDAIRQFISSSLFLIILENFFGQ